MKRMISLLLAATLLALSLPASSLSAPAAINASGTDMVGDGRLIVFDTAPPEGITYDAEYLAGDGNCDGRVTAQDILLLRSELAGMLTPSTPATDVNGDGKVTALDTVLLRRCVSGAVTLGSRVSVGNTPVSDTDGRLTLTSLGGEVVLRLSREALYNDFTPKYGSLSFLPGSFEKGVAGTTAFDVKDGEYRTLLFNSPLGGDIEITFEKTSKGGNMITIDSIGAASSPTVAEEFASEREYALRGIGDDPYKALDSDVVEIRFDSEEKVNRLVRRTNSTAVSFENGAMKLTVTGNGNDPWALIDLEEIGISADKYKYVVMIYKMPIGTEKTEAASELFFSAGDVAEPTAGCSKYANLAKPGSYNIFFAALNSADYWKGTVHSVRIDYYSNGIVGDSYLVDSLMFFKNVSTADTWARKAMWHANEGTCAPTAPHSVEELRDCLLSDASKDRNSSEHVKDGVLRISCGTADRLTEERIEDRIADCIYNTYYINVGVEIVSGFETLKAAYAKDESACGSITCKFTADGRCAIASLPVEFFVKEIVFDHDLGSDCDDGGAAAMLIKAHREGYCKVLAITGCVYNPYASYCVGVMCSRFGVDDIDIGINRDRDTLNQYYWYNCTKAAAEKYLGGNYPDYESNVALIRRKLAGSHGNVTFITTGCLATVMALLESGADSLSDKTGLELFKDNVGHYVCGGGNFPYGTRENNFLCDAEAANVCINNYLKGFENITFVGAEVAGIVFSGSILMNYDDYILRDIYNVLRPGSCNHNSWDLGVMHYSVFGSAYKQFATVKGCTVAPYGDGYMTLTDGGPHNFVVRVGDEGVLSQVFNYWMIPEA